MIRTEKGEPMSDLISRQSVITAIQNDYEDTECGEDKCAVWKNVGLTCALHIIQDMPSAQPTQNTRVNSNNSLDTISREAAIAVADSSDCVGISVDVVKKVTDEVVKGLKQLPAAQPERMRGHWLRNGRMNVYGGFEVECSVCHDNVMITNIDYEHYCRNCGARMDEEEVSE